MHAEYMLSACTHELGWHADCLPHQVRPWVLTVGRPRGDEFRLHDADWLPWPPTTAPPAPHALVPPTTAPPYSGARGADRYRYDGLPFPPGPLRKAAHHGAADRYDGLPFPPSPRLAAYVARLERRHRRAARQVRAFR